MKLRRALLLEVHMRVIHGYIAFTDLAPKSRTGFASLPGSMRRSGRRVWFAEFLDRREPGSKPPCGQLANS
jgi:hypothetical protein